MGSDRQPWTEAGRALLSWYDMEALSTDNEQRAMRRRILAH